MYEIHRCMKVSVTKDRVEFTECAPSSKPWVARVTGTERRPNPKGGGAFRDFARDFVFLRRLRNGEQRITPWLGKGLYQICDGEHKELLMLPSLKRLTRDEAFQCIDDGEAPGENMPAHIARAIDDLATHGMAYPEAAELVLGKMA